MNSVNIIGRLTRDPELRYIPNSGNAVCKFTLAIGKGYSKEKEQEIRNKGQQVADFINIVVWGKQAENAANYLVKGRLVAVNGRIQTGSYDDKDGKRVYTFDVVANNVEFLEFKDKQTTDFQAPEGFNETNMGELPF